MSTQTLPRKPQPGTVTVDWKIILDGLDPKAPVKALVGTAPKGAPAESFYDPITDEHITFDSDTATVSDPLTGVTTLHTFATGTVTQFL